MAKDCEDIVETFMMRQRRDPKTGVVISEAYYNAARRQDRGGDLPSVVYYDRETGEPREFWFARDGKVHREGGPAFYKVDPISKVVVRERWSRNGKFHREGGKPAVIARHRETGEILREEFWVNGQKCRRPAKSGPPPSPSDI